MRHLAKEQKMRTLSKEEMSQIVGGVMDCLAEGELRPNAVVHIGRPWPSLEPARGTSVPGAVDPGAGSTVNHSPGLVSRANFDVASPSCGH